MNKKEFIEQLKLVYPTITDEQFLLFDTYKHFLQQENKKYNLTRLDNEELIYEKYFYYSIIPFLKIDLKNKQILDIGSGSGVPGIVLKIIEPSIKLTIIESNHKRVLFMESLCKLFKFEDVIFLTDRAESCAHTYIEKFDIVTSRAVSMLNVLLEISCQFVKIGGLIVEPKSNQYFDELNLSLPLLHEFGLSEPEIINHDEKNVILVFNKLHHANPKYPREWRYIIKDNKKANMHE